MTDFIRYGVREYSENIPEKSYSIKPWQYKDKTLAIQDAIDYIKTFPSDRVFVERRVYTSESNLRKGFPITRKPVWSYDFDYEETGKLKYPDIQIQKNTLFSYLYRDGANYKTHNEVVVEGQMSKDEIDAILSSLEDGIHFIPRQIGLPEDRGGYSCAFGCDEFDHAYFEVDADSFSETDRKPTIDMTAKELSDAFKEQKSWDDYSFLEEM